MAKQKFRYAKASRFFRGEDIHQYVKVLKNLRKAAERTFCDAILPLDSQHQGV
jgi:hypothetical protein